MSPRQGATRSRGSVPGRRRCPVIGATVPGRPNVARSCPPCLLDPRALPRPRPRARPPRAAGPAPRRAGGHRGGRASATAVAPRRAAPGHRRRARAGARPGARRPDRAVERGRRRLARRRHRHDRRVLRRRPAGGRRRASTAVEALDAGEADARVLRGAAARPPRHPDPGDGVLPLQQRGGHRGRARRARASGC